MLLIPVVPIDKPDKGQTAEFPTHRECYLVGNNGVFKQMDNPFFRVRFQAAKVAGLAEIKDDVHIKVKKLPLVMFNQVESFFARINNKFKGEAVVVLAYSIAQDKWAVKIPKQQPQGMHVKYDLSAGDVCVVIQDSKGEMQHINVEANKPVPLEVTDFEVFGTIHSHCDSGAFHSGTDDKDEFGFDGLHITIGHLNKPKRDYAMRWILGGKSFKIESLDYVVDFPADAVVPETWINQVTERPKEVALVHASQSHLQQAPFGNGYQNTINYDQHRSMAGGTQQWANRDLVKSTVESLSPQQQIALEEERSILCYAFGGCIDEKELDEWAALRLKHMAGGELTHDQKGYVLERFYRIPIQMMTDVEHRVYDLLETDPWLEDVLMDNGMCYILTTDENALDELLAACVDDDNHQIFDPELIKKNRDKAIEGILNDRLISQN